MLSKENSKVRLNCLKRSLNWTEENGECEMLILHFIRQIKWQIRFEGKRVCYVTNQISETELFRKIVQQVVKKLKYCKEFAVQKLKELDHRNSMRVLLKRKRITLQWISLWFRFRICKTRWIPGVMQKNSMILKQGAGLDHPTVPVNPWVFRLAAILVCSLIHGTHRVQQHCGRSTCERWAIFSTLPKFKDFGIVFLQIEAYEYGHNCGTVKKEREENRRIIRYQLHVLPGHCRLGIPYIVQEEPIFKTVLWTNQRHPISKLHFGRFADSVDFQCWKVNFKTEACSNSLCPTITMSWIKRETTKSVDDILTSQSVEGRDFPDFEVPDAKIASGLRQIISNQ